MALPLGVVVAVRLADAVSSDHISDLVPNSRANYKTALLTAEVQHQRFLGLTVVLEFFEAGGLDFEHHGLLGEAGRYVVLGRVYVPFPVAHGGPPLSANRGEVEAAGKAAADLASS